MKYQSIVLAALLFFAPWLLFFIAAIPELAERGSGFATVLLSATMLVSPFLGAYLVRRAQRAIDPAASLLGPVLFAVSALIINAPVILLVAVVALCSITVMGGSQCN